MKIRVCEQESISYYNERRLGKVCCQILHQSHLLMETERAGRGEDGEDDKDFEDVLLNGGWGITRGLENGIGGGGERMLFKYSNLCWVGCCIEYEVVVGEGEGSSSKLRKEGSVFLR